MKTNRTNAKPETALTFPKSSSNPVADWFIRLAKGVGIGIGFILPGLSGGVLAVIFGMYDIILRFLANLRREFLKHVQFFIPVGIGGLIGVFLFSKVVSVALDKYAAIAISLFLGFVVGTFPSLLKKAGAKGRKTSDVVLMLVLAIAFAWFMIWVGKAQLAQLPANFATWLMSGALIGLGVIVPGMSPSNFLLYFGLYEKMTVGISKLDFGVIIPLCIGLLACILLFAKFVDFLFTKYYAKMYHFILGLVIGSSIAILVSNILPNFQGEALVQTGMTSPILAVSCIIALLLGTLLSWLFSKVEEKYDPDKVKEQMA